MSDSDDSIDNPDEFDSDEDDDPFSFQHHSFTKKKPQKDDDDDSDEEESDEDVLSPSPKKGAPTAVGRRGRNSGKTVEERLKQLQTKTKKKGLSLDDEASDDSDIEVVGGNKSAPPAAQKQQQPQTASHSTIELLSSDDEIEIQSRAKRPRYIRGTPTSSVAKTSNRDADDTIQKARMARMQLTRAQQYRAEDVNVCLPPSSLAQSPMLNPALIMAQQAQALAHQNNQAIAGMPLQNPAMGAFASTNANMRMPVYAGSGTPLGMNQPPRAPQAPVAAPIQAPRSAAASLGQPIMLTLRTQEIVNGRRSEASFQDVLSIREREPLEKLLEKYKKKKGLAKTAHVVMTFDGEAVDLSKTPSHYDMEEEELIDVVVKR